MKTTTETCGLRRAGSPAPGAPLRVLVVDDSVHMRTMLTNLLAEDPRLEVVGMAANGSEALAQVERLRPDVVTLDLEMPRMDGLTALREIMARQPTPVVLVSTLTHAGAEATLQGLTLGAVDFVTKPAPGRVFDRRSLQQELVAKVKTAGQSRLLLPPATVVPGPGNTGLPGHRGPSRLNPAERVVVIGASTGGPRSLQILCAGLPADLSAAVLIVQHMPPNFTQSLAQRLDRLTAAPVREAAPGDPLRRGEILVAPGGYHTVVTAEGRIQLTQDPPVWGVRPSVDVTMGTVVKVYGARALGVILTGMGQDGAQGMHLILQAGGQTLAEHESSCVVYGMPRVVIERGYAQQVVPLSEMATALTKALAEGQPAWG